METHSFVLKNKDAQYLLLPDLEHPENFTWVDSFETDCLFNTDKLLEISSYFCGAYIHRVIINININPKPSFMVPHEA